MRIIKFITISAIAVVMGGTSVALGQEGATASSGLSGRGPAMGPVGGQEISGAHGSATTAERRRTISGEHGTALERGRVIRGERGGAMSIERGRAISGERGKATSGERGQAVSGERGR